MKEINILYIHGMGGGGDSRIPSILKEHINESYPNAVGRNLWPENGMPETAIHYNIIIRTYSFDPEIAVGQIKDWIDETRPALVVGESLGSIQAIRVKGLPHVLVSPSLGAPKYLGYLAFLAKIPGMAALLDHIYKPKDGDRQKLHFTYDVLKKYKEHRHIALKNTPLNGSTDNFFAFFGTKDHYRKTGVVSLRAYRKYFGNSYAIYDGTHFMEEEYVISMLIPKIKEIICSSHAPDTGTL